MSELGVILKKRTSLLVPDLTNPPSLGSFLFAGISLTVYILYVNIIL